MSNLNGEREKASLAFESGDGAVASRSTVNTNSKPDLPETHTHSIYSVFLYAQVNIVQRKDCNLHPLTSLPGGLRT